MVILNRRYAITVGWSLFATETDKRGEKGEKGRGEGEGEERGRKNKKGREMERGRERKM